MTCIFPSPASDALTASDIKWVPHEHLLNREVSWLRFNSRVLALAEDEKVPLLERVKFLAIVSSNMDEFFMKRIGGLKLRIRLGLENRSADGQSARQQLSSCRPHIADIQTRQEALFQNTLVPMLSDQGIRFARWEDLDGTDKKWCRSYFERNIDPVLTPLAVDASHPFPFISNLSLSLSISFLPQNDMPTRFVRIKVPHNRPRWVPLPDGRTFVPLEQVISRNMDYLFPGEDLSLVHFFRVTRSIVVDTGDYQDDLYQDMGERPGQLRREVADHLRERRFAPAVRIEVNTGMPDELRRWLLDQLNLAQEDLYEHSGPLGLVDLMSMKDIERPDLKYKPWRPKTPPRLRVLKSVPAELQEPNIFSIIRQGDILVHHPFQDFDSSVLHFVKAASKDPRVLAIKQTLYRTEGDSPIVHSLVRAAENGKQVAVLVELKARLDEHQNLHWSQVLESAGAHVTYGVEDLKTHTKLVLVVREEDKDLRRYVHIGTGNYHSGTARQYTDLGLITADPAICDDVARLFNTLTAYSRHDAYAKLLVAPHTMRKGFLELITREIELARKGRYAEISAKMNQLEDPKIIGKLYEASQAGVKINLIIRGFCTLRPGVPNLSENIRVTSIVGRFLEHHRIFVFHNDGAPEYFIGSADWMERNLSHRVETVVKVEDPACTQEIEHVVRVYSEDNCSSWLMHQDGTYTRSRPADGELPRPAQEVLMREHSTDEEK